MFHSVLLIVSPEDCFLFKKSPIVSTCHHLTFSQALVDSFHPRTFLHPVTPFSISVPFFFHPSITVIHLACDQSPKNLYKNPQEDNQFKVDDFRWPINNVTLLNLWFYTFHTLIQSVQVIKTLSRRMESTKSVDFLKKGEKKSKSPPSQHITIRIEFKNILFWSLEIFYGIFQLIICYFSYIIKFEKKCLRQSLNESLIFFIIYTFFLYIYLPN